MQPWSLVARESGAKRFTFRRSALGWSGIHSLVPLNAPLLFPSTSLLQYVLDGFLLYLRLAGRSPMGILPCHATALPRRGQHCSMGKLRERGPYHLTRARVSEAEATRTIIVDVLEAFDSWCRQVKILSDDLHCRVKNKSCPFSFAKISPVFSKPRLKRDYILSKGHRLGSLSSIKIAQLGNAPLRQHPYLPPPCPCVCARRCRSTLMTLSFTTPTLLHSTFV